MLTCSRHCGDTLRLVVQVGVTAEGKAWPEEYQNVGKANKWWMNLLVTWLQSSLRIL